jgi:hypothetical protein
LRIRLIVILSEASDLASRPRDPSARKLASKMTVDGPYAVLVA